MNILHRYPTALSFEIRIVSLTIEANTTLVVSIGITCGASISADVLLRKIANGQEHLYFEIKVGMGGMMTLCRGLRHHLDVVLSARYDHHAFK
jgi:hypothetical protein